MEFAQPSPRSTDAAVGPERMREAELLRYRAMFDNLAAGVCVIEMIRDADGRPIDYRFLQTNRAFEAHTGLSDVVGKRMRALRPELEQHWFDTYDGVARTGRPARFRNVAAALGRVFDVHAVCLPGPAANEVLVLFEDVSKQVAAEDAASDGERRLFEQRNKLMTLIDHLPVGVAFIAQDGRVALANPAFRRFVPGDHVPSLDPDEHHRWTASDDTGRPLPPERFPSSRALTGETVLDHTFRYAPPDSPPLWMRISSVPVHVAGGHVDGAIMVIVDVDEQTRAREALQRLAADLEGEVARRTADRDRMWRLSRDLMLVARMDGRINAINPAWRALLGWREDQLVGASLLDFIHPDDAIASTRELRALGEGRSVQSFDNRYRAADGSFRHLSWTAVSADGLIQAVARDVTDIRARADALREAEDQLRQAQKMEAVGQLTGGVAHDFNNLLTIIRSSTDLLRRPELPEARRTRYIDAITEASDRAAKLTGQLLAFARRQALKPEVFDVAERVRASGDLLRSILGARVAIELDLGDAPAPVEADRNQFETALINMAANARDAMDGAGTLRIAVRRLESKPAVRGHAASNAPFVALSVEDSGSGIPADRIAQVFEPFFTTKEVGRGTGLGLSQVYGFAKQSGGDVLVESEEGHGARFTMFLPRTERLVPPAPLPAAAEPPLSGEGRRVLVVEDNLDVGAFSTQILEDLGFETHWAADAAEALTLLDGGLAPDIVFSDVVMPGMSGVELGETIRTRWPRLPVILTSGYSNVLAEEGRHGFELVQKPYAAEELARLLARVLPTRGGA